MAKNSKIQWTHHTFNPWRGCEKVSEGCKHCYAEQLVTKRQGLPLWGKAAPRKVAAESTWREPLRWNRQAEQAGERRRVFCASLADVFEDRPDLIFPRARLFELIARTPALDWLLLTKRPEVVRSLVPQQWLYDADYCNACDKHGCISDLRGGFRVHARCGGAMYGWPRNVWIGCTVENQQLAEERLPELVRIPAPVRFVSYEPALGPVDWKRWLDESAMWCRRCGTKVSVGETLGSCADCGRALEPGGIDWLIVGGESGPGARPFDLAWARSAVQQCKAAGVTSFVKQFGPYPHDGAEGAGWAYDFVTGKDRHWRVDYRLPSGNLAVCEIRDRKGGDMSEWPEELRVREFPEVRRG